MTWPVRSGAIPPLADNHSPRPETGAGLVSDLAPATGTLSLYVSLVKKLLGGVSFGNDTPRICLATRAGWIG